MDIEAEKNSIYGIADKSFIEEVLLILSNHNMSKDVSVEM